MPIERLRVEHQTRKEAFELRDLLFNVCELCRDVVDRRGVLETIVLAESLEDVRRLGSEVLGRLPVDALALVAAMVDPFLTAVTAQPGVDSGGQPLARPLDPVTSVERAALRRAAAFGMRTIGPTKPVLTVPVDSVMAAFGDHDVHVRVVFAALAALAGMNRERVGEMLAIRQ